MDSDTEVVETPVPKRHPSMIFSMAGVRAGPMLGVPMQIKAEESSPSEDDFVEDGVDVDDGVDDGVDEGEDDEQENADVDSQEETKTQQLDGQNDEYFSPHLETDYFNQAAHQIRSKSIKVVSFSQINNIHPPAKEDRNSVEKCDAVAQTTAEKPELRDEEVQCGRDLAEVNELSVQTEAVRIVGFVSQEERGTQTDEVEKPVEAILIERETQTDVPDEQTMQRID